MRTFLGCLVSGILFALAGTLYAQSAKEPITTANQAEARARSIFHQLGWTDTGEAQVQALAVNSTGRANRWNVRIGEHEASFGVEGQLSAGFVRGGTEGIIKIDAQTASAKARYYLSLLDLNRNDARIVSNKAENHTSVPSGTAWIVTMHRFCHNFEYQDDFIRVQLNPLDGRLLGLGYNFASPIPKSTKVTLTQQQAAEKAGAFFQKLGMTLGDVKTAECKIVVPDNEWDIASRKITTSEYKQETYSRLAWVIDFEAPGPKYIQRSQVWVDAENGSILGGFKYR